jgi:hypothetical protein
MIRVTGEKVVVDKEPSVITGFLGDLTNFEALMPEQVINWEASRDKCSFTISGTASLGFRIEPSGESNQVRYVSTEPSPFSFILACNVLPLETKQSETWFFFEANLNPMMQMMVTRPLQNFLNILAIKLKEVMEK